eukprot:NODE_62_length_26495_cov_0.832853.p8 type:complete len:456 gc:universal NODE_62_length_26495_cov_0.832853:5985-4618(-)
MHRQTQINIIASLGVFLFGADSGLINKIQTFHTFKTRFDLNSAVLSMIVVSGIFGSMIGSIGCGVMADKLGRKKSMYLMSFLFIIGLFWQILSVGIQMFLFGRFISGIGIGCLYAIAPLYVGEICDASKRGMLVSAQHLSITVANLVAFVGVIYLEDINIFYMEDWQLAIAVQMIPALLLIIGCSYLPKSPRWLMMRHDYQEAKDALKFIFQEDDILLEKRYNAIYDGLNKEMKQLSWDQVIRIYWRRLLMGMTLQMFKRLSGVNALLYYSSKLYQQVIPQYVNEMGILQSLLNFVFTIPSLYLTDRLGRKTLLIAGSVGCCLGLCMTGTSMLVNWPILAVIGVFIAIINFAYAIGPVTIVVCSEIFPLQMRSRGQAACMTSGWIFTLLINSTTPLMFDFLQAYTFYVFGASCFLFVIWLFYELPETKGLSLEEVNEMLNLRHNSSESIRSFDMK